MRLFKKKNDVKKSSEKIGEFKMDYLPDDQHDGEYGEHKPKAKNRKRVTFNGKRNAWNLYFRTST